MATGQEVVIVDSLGNEHVFPPGFDPQRAAGIVKAQSDERRAQAPSALSGEQYPSADMTRGVVSGLVGEAKNQGMAILDAIKAGAAHVKAGTLPEGPSLSTMGNMIMAPVHAVQRMGAGTPEDLGAGMLQTAEQIPVVKGAGGVALSGVKRIPAIVGGAARALPESTAPLVSAAGVVHGIYSGSPTEVIASAAGEGTLHKLIDRLKKVGVPPKVAEAAPAAEVPPPTPVTAPPAPPLAPTTTPAEALAASHAQRMAKLGGGPQASHLTSIGTDNNFGRLPTAGNAVYAQEGLPSELEQQLMDRQAREADALTNMPAHMRNANLDVVGSASDVGASPTPADVLPKVPQGKGSMTEVNDILKTLQNHLDTVKPSKTPAWYEQPTASHAGDIEGKQIFKVHGGPNDGAAVTADQLETLGIEKPKRAPASLAVSHEVTRVPMGASGPLHAPGVTVRGPRMTPARADLRSAMMDRLMQHYTENSPY